jgi:HPr kinase/phosphorylase
MLLHASCVAHGDQAVLILGPPGSGKSDLVLRLIHRPGWRLVADDQVALYADGAALRATAPPRLRGMLEVRGLGILQGLPVVADPAPAIRLAVHLAPRPAVPRLPLPTTWAAQGHAVPAITLHAFDAATPLKLELALAALRGEVSLTAGALPGDAAPAP